MPDHEKLADAVFRSVEAYLGRSMAPLMARLDALEKRQPERGAPGERGADGLNGQDGVGVAGASLSDGGLLILRLTNGNEIEVGLVAGHDGKDGIDGPPGRDGEPGQSGRDGRDGVDGKDGAPGEPGLPGRDGANGRDGVDGAPGKDGEPGADGQAGRDGVDGRDGTDGKDGSPGRDGKDVDPEAVASLLAAEVEKAVAAIPVPKDGADGRDGVGLASALINRAGELVVTLTNGDTRELGAVVGRDGQDGRPGADGQPGRDGRDGDPGADGLGFDDMEEVVEDEGRTIVRRYRRGEVVKEFRHAIAVPIDRGVYKAGETYRPGDGVTWGGSWWLAQKETDARPGEGDAWRLAVKRGRDGRDGKDGERGLQGKQGDPGRDLTQIGPDGQKW